MKKVALHNLGCKVNSYEIDVMQQNLVENGFLIVPFDEMADVYIVNTCTVTNIADQKSRKMLNRAREKNPDAIVIAVGCFVQLEEKALGKTLDETPIDLAIGNNKKNELVPLLNEFIKKHSISPKAQKSKAERSIIDINNETAYEEMTLKKTTSHTRAFIKIQDGCNQFCSYCIIPYARGRVRSRREEAIINELTELVNKGCREVVLTGINLSSYGSDFNNENALIELLMKLSDIPSLSRIRFGSLEPRVITTDFIEKITALKKICPHFHLSLQSGCDTVLKRMNRHYLANEYLAKVEILRSAYKSKYGSDYEPAITTDIIVGFPGETEAEYMETESFIRKIGFSEIHIFKYSKRKGTKAAIMPAQITAAIKKERSIRLHEIGKDLSKQFLCNYLGKEITVILEEMKIINGTGYWLGYAAEYIKIAIPQCDFSEAKPESGQLIKAIITEFLTDEIMQSKIKH